jgi:hypothetical protein
MAYTACSNLHAQAAEEKNGSRWFPAATFPFEQHLKHALADPLRFGY